MKRFVLFLCSVLICGVGSAQMRISPDDFSAISDSLELWLSQRTGVSSKVELSRVLNRSGRLDFYFTQDLGDYPWRDPDVRWFKAHLSDNVPSGYRFGEVFVKNAKLEEFAVPDISYDGRARQNKFTHTPSNTSPTVVRLSDRSFSKGLRGRHIALWQSHGRYYDSATDSWKWQRAVVNRTVEDMYTQSYVLKYLIPMLENAGANVMTPRERDIQPMEYVIDRDPGFEGERTGLMRRTGRYSESGGWKASDGGFRDFSETYTLTDNPFTAGGSRQIQCSPKGNAEAKWTARIEDRGLYAVYVSYKSFRNSSSEALYTVKHLGGETSFHVDQRRGDGTWMYLGTFEFGKDSDACVTLSNKGKASDVVSADAVKIGGGMGKVSRGGAGTSGMAGYMEGALYQMPWYGVDSTITTLWDSDYTGDFADRGPWVKMLRDSKDIPFDLSLGFHTDAGLTPCDSIVGTLAIYTLLADGSRKFPDGNDRAECRVLCDYVQTQVCRDIQASYDSWWTRRMLWNRSYSESRTSDVPAMLLELLGHQNFADMRYGLDPSFQFAVGRSVYKGILKFFSDIYNVPYSVQPLPVKNFSVTLEGNNAILKWTGVEDEAEPTARPKGYRVYTRIDDGGFDNGTDVNEEKLTLAIKPGHIYSFKVVAWNDGGYSFPSEVLCAARSNVSYADNQTVLVVNNFTRVSGPSWIDSPSYAGFDAGTDSGVPYINDISYVGEVYDFRRDREWFSDDAAGVGASYDDCAGLVVAGNTFDYVYVHGRALLELGRSFCSMSSSAFCDGSGQYDVLDLICGKQVTTMVGRGEKPDKYRVFTPELQEALRNFVSAGGDVIVSGANIATDIWSDVYPVKVDKEFAEQSREFVKNVLGYTFQSDHGTNKGSVDGKPFYSTLNSDCYCVENPDAIAPAGSSSRTVMRYDGTGRSAAVYFDAGGYKVASFGFPLEVLKSADQRRDVIGEALNFFRGL